MSGECTVVARDDRRTADGHDLDLERWSRLAGSAAAAEGGVGELTLTFVDIERITELNAHYMGADDPTDVLAFPMDDEPMPGVPTLLGDIVVCPQIAAQQSSDHAGSVDDEIALLVVHGLLHVLGHDHVDPGETARMRERELHLLETLHWHGPAPAGFRQAQD